MSTEENILDRLESDSRSGLLTEEGKKKIADEYRIPVSKVESLYTFYDHESKVDRICSGLPCSMKRDGGDYESSAHGSLKKESCLGYCNHGPVVKMGGKFMTDGHDKLSEIEESTEEYIEKHFEDISSYRETGGYTALGKLLEHGESGAVHSVIEKAGLKGMGGAGFPVILKWKSFGENRRDDAILLVNAHEGEPGTYKDRSILELNPHRMLEGALIAAVSNGIKKIVIGLKKEYEHGYNSLRTALAELKKDFGDQKLPEIRIEVVRGSYVTGEETALMEGIEGERSEPRLRPPFPTERGLYGVPTLVHNVETLCAISGLLREDSDGITKRFCVSGDVNSPGVYDAKLGITVRDLLDKHADGSKGNIKAFLPGGLSGGILPGTQSDLKLDFESVRGAGAGLGTGALIAVSDENCTVNVMSNIMNFFSDESCGKCMPCRYGTSELRKVMSSVRDGNATVNDLETAEETARAMIDGSICALGQAAGKMFLDEIKYFGEEIRQHMDAGCPNGICGTGGD